MAISEEVAKLFVSLGLSSTLASDVNAELSKAESSFTQIGNSMKATGKDLTLHVTAPIAAIGAASIYTAAQFDDSMRKVQSKVGATTEEFEQMREQALQLGADTAFSASEAADGMEYLAAAGFDAEQIMAAMPGMLALASSDAVDLGVAAEIAGATLNGFGLEAAEASRVADVLAKSAAATNAGVTDMGEAMAYVAPVAKSTGMSLEEAAAAIGILSNAGIKGSMAGTTLRSAISGLLTPTKEAQEVMDRLGVSVKDSSGEMRPLNDIVGQFEKSGLSAADAMTIFGDRAGPGMLALIQQGQGGLVDMTKELENSGGAAQEMADLMESGPGGAFRQFEGSVESLSIAIGDTLIPILLPLMDWLKGIVDWMSTLDSGTLTIIVTIAALAAAIGPLLIVLGMMASGIGSIIAIIPALMAGLTLLAAHPIILALVLIIAAAVLLEMKFGLISKTAAVLSDGFTWLADGIGDFVEWITSAVNWSDVLYNAFLLLLGPIGWIQIAMNALGVSWNDVWDGMISGMRWAVNTMIDGFNSIIGAANAVNSLGGINPFAYEIPKIPRLAEGGIVTKPTIAMIGEAGPEAVVPLTGSGAASVGAGINITGNTFVVREEADIQKVAKELYTLIDRTNRGRGAGI